MDSGAACFRRVKVCLLPGVFWRHDAIQDASLWPRAVYEMLMERVKTSGTI